MSRVRRVSCYPACTPPSPGDVQVLERWKAAANHLLSSAHNALQSVSVPDCGSSVPNGDGGGKDGLNDGRVKLHQHLGRQLDILPLPEKVHPLLGLFDQGADGRLPLQVLCDGGPEEADGVHSGDGRVCQDGGAVTFLNTCNKTFDVRVYTSLSSDCEKTVKYPKQCFSGTACFLSCPESNTPKNIRNFTSERVTWVKQYFSDVKESDRGDYTCVRSFLFNGRTVYSMTFITVLEVNTTGTSKDNAIISPQPWEVFSVDLGSSLVINCTARTFASDFPPELYWINTFNNSHIYSSNSVEILNEEERITSSLVFKEVTKEDLSTVFTCKLESDQPSVVVNVTLALKERPSYAAVTVTAVVIPLVLVMFVLIYIKYKIHIALFLRDTLRWHSRASDGKSFDAFMLYYASEQGPGLSEDDSETLQTVLEDHFGYSLCLFHRDVLPGRAEADAVLECVEQCRAVVLVPASTDLSCGSSLLSAFMKPSWSVRPASSSLKKNPLRKHKQSLCQRLYSCLQIWDTVSRGEGHSHSHLSSGKNCDTTCRLCNKLTKYHCCLRL
ncbi:hypothetical protein WMY93_019189 [Mugilogobius chulae]|uniref:TIR domain-containing protein n=1 Tax=Mugilogobius chulae TaxID=88201 RepID=A0AAW0NDL5_9GOBI